MRYSTIGGRWVIALLGAVGCAVGAAAAPVSQSATHAVRISPDALAKVISKVDLQIESVFEYGSFAWVELAPAEFELLRSSGELYEERPEAFTLHLGERSFDPRAGVPSPPPGWGMPSANRPDLHLIQYGGPPRAEWLAGLRAEGLTIVQYVFPSTYVVWGESDALSTLGAQEAAARWTGPFVPAYRVLPRWRSLGDSPVDVDVLFYRGADVDAGVIALRTLGAKLRERTVLNDRFEEIGVTISGAAFQAAAAVPGVYSIQPVPTDGGLRGEMSDQVNVNNVDGSNLAFPGYVGWLSGVGLSGAGVIIANVDGGVQDTHPDLVNRFLPCSGTTCGGSATDSHGTHTAGIMAADGSSGTLDGFGFRRGLGQAPGANLVEQLYSPFFQQAGGMLLLIRESYANGASLSGNSWGPAGTPRGYDNDTMQVDIGVRDADAVTAGNQSMSYVLSFMNGNGGTSSQGTPDEGKNLFTIGSTKMQTSGGAQILQIDDVSANSAHGPALDGRTIPHMVAPGCAVDSTVPGGYAVSGFCGTSMASPHVSGAVALFIEYYRGLPGFVADPSPALIKAAFIAVAHDLAGHLDADGGVLGHPFDSKQGWGRMDLEAVVDPQAAVSYFDNPLTFDNVGEEWTGSLAAADPAEPMRIMLVWTDAPGHGLGGSTPAWNNDLDLVVESGPDTYRGNNFGANGWSVTGGAADWRNNTEGVFLGPAAPASVTVRVVAADINSDGIPSEGDATDQDFAIVCYNCIEEPGFALSATPGEVSVCAPDAAEYTIEVAQILGYSDAVTLSASGEPAGTSVIFGVNPVTPPDATTMTVTNMPAATPGTFSIVIQGTAPGLTRNTGVGLRVYDSVPQQITLIGPADDAVDVSARPNFTWAPVAQAATYEFELATDAAFVDVFDSIADLTDPSYTSSTTLAQTTEYYWRVRASNECGTGPYSAIFSFTTRDGLPILLVDDDDNTPDVRSFYINALDALSADYDVWDTNNSDNEPSSAVLSQYSTVVWFTGAEFGGASGPGAAGETALSGYLDGGGCAFITSQDYLWDRGLTTFMSSYLGVGAAQSDVGHTTVTGTGAVFGGTGPYVLSYPFTNYSDVLSPNAGGQIAFTGDFGDAAVFKDAGMYRTTYWGFPFEAISSAADRSDLLARVVDWCEAPPIVDCNDNGVDDAEDIATGFSDDCNGNAIPDDCDLAEGSSPDVNGNGVPDECDPVVPPALEAEHVRKNRYISVVPNVDSPTLAYRVELTEGPGATGVVGWIGEPFDPSCEDETGSPLAGNPPCAGLDAVARVVDSPVFRLWGEELVHVGDCEIVPVATFGIRATVDGVEFSDALEIGTILKPGFQHHGDVVGEGTGVDFTPPQGVVNVTDVSAYLFAAQGLPQAPHWVWVDLTGLGLGAPPNFIINVSDLQQILKGIDVIPYLDSNMGMNLNPADCP